MNISLKNRYAGFGMGAFILSTLFAPSALAEAISLPQWQTHDFVFNTKNKTTEPFELEFYATFKNEETGKTLNVPAFYNGNDEYIVRIALPEKGQWHYSVVSGASDVNGKTGDVTVTPSQNKGKVVIDPQTKTTFRYENGEIYNPSAYELDWLFYLDRDNKDLSQTKSITSYLKTGGFNQVLMNVYAYGSTNKNAWSTKDIDDKYNFNLTKDFPFLGDNTKPDYSSLNVDYFKKLDEKIAYLESQGIQAHLMIYVWNKAVNWAPLGSKEDKRYFDYVVKRYSGYNNIIWDVAKESMDYGHADAQFLNDRINRIRTLDPRQHLVTLHDFIYAESPFLAANLDYISIQEWSPNIAEKTKELVKLHPQKPIHNIENGCYETTTHRIFSGAYNNSETCLDRNYQIYFNGAFTTHYWQNTSWFELNYEPQKLPQDKQPKMQWHKIFKDFIDAYPLTNWKPHQFHFSTWSLINDQKDIIFYLQADGDGIKGHLTPEYKDMKYKAKWLSTQTGEIIAVDNKDMKGQIWIDAMKPEKFVGKPAILILEHIN